MVRQIKFVGLANSGWFVLFVIFLGCSDSESDRNGEADRNGNMDSANDPAVSAKKSLAAPAPSQPKKTKTLKGREADAPPKTPQDDSDVNRKKHTEELQYSLHISNFSELAYDTDDAVIVGGPWIDGTAMVYANDSPVHLYSWGGQMFPIQHFLDPGKNTVRVEVDCKEPIFAKIVTVYPSKFNATGKIEAVLAKVRFAGGKKTLSLEFDADVREPILEELGTDPESRALREAEARQLVKDLLASFREHDGAAFFSHVTPLQWQDSGALERILPEPQEHRKQHVRNVKLINDESIKLLTKFEDIKFVFGKRAAFAYSDTHIHGGVLLRYEVKNGETIDSKVYPSLPIVRIGGVWGLWEFIK